MAQDNATTADENRTETKRFDESFAADDLIKGDRIDPAIIPRSRNVDVGDDVARHLAQLYDEDDDRTFGVRLIARSEDRWGDVQTALVYDPEDDLFIRVGGHTRSGAMNQKERDWKVREVGREVVVDDMWDVDIPDLDSWDQSEREFVEEWVKVVFDEIRHDGDYAELVEFDGKTFTFRDHDNRTAKVRYYLE